MIGADSEHEDAKLEGTTVTEFGAIRDSSVHIARSYTFADGEIKCSLSLKETEYNEILNLWIPNPERGKLTECWEMIPYLGGRPRRESRMRRSPC